jgi:alpha-tubulin suppressor-like RCC1 family protein
VVKQFSYSCIIENSSQISWNYTVVQTCFQFDQRKPQGIMYPSARILTITTLAVSTLAAQGAVRHVGAGNHHSVFLEPTSLEVWTVGEDILGQLGKGTGGELLKNNAQPHRVEGGWTGTPVDVSAGLNTNAVVTDDGELWTWGFNRHGQLGHSHGEDFTSEPARVEGLPPVRDVEAGSGYMLALTAGGELFAWGNNALGQLGLGPDAPKVQPQPAMVPLPNGVRLADVATGINQVVALTTDGRVFAWGSNRSGQAGGPADMRAVPAPVEVLIDEAERFTAVGVGNYTSFAITASGRLFGWGENQFGQIPGAATKAVRTPTEILLPEGSAPAFAISGGARYVHAVLADGTVLAWGVNGPQGQFGTGTTKRDASATEPPLPIADLALRELHTQTNHSVGLTRDGRFVGWGSNAQGRLAQAGDPLPVAFPVPVTISLNQPVVP